MTAPGGWGPGPSPYGQPRQGQPWADARPKRRGAWLWVGAGAVVLVVVLIAVLAVVFIDRDGGPSGQEQSAQSAKAPEAKDKRKSGGPFLDPITTRPVSLWTAQARDLVGGDQSSSVRFMTANESTAVVLGLSGKDYSLIALDAATGEKKWQVPAPFGDALTTCEISGDSGVLCSTEFSAGPEATGDAPPDTFRLAFFGPDGTAQKTLTLPLIQPELVHPLPTGFLIDQYDTSEEGKTVSLVSFSGSGERRWEAKSARNQNEFRFSSGPGLFILSDGFTPQVYSLADGKPIGDYSDLGSGQGSPPKNVRVTFTTSGFTATNGTKVDVFDAQGKKVNQIAGWSTPTLTLPQSSDQCGQIILVNDEGGFAAADAASGQILWQSQGDPEQGARKLSCVGGYLLSQANGAKALDIHELDGNGKKTGSITLNDGLWDIVGTDGSTVLLKYGSTSPEYDAYELASGKRLWVSPTGESGQYLFCAHGGVPARLLGALAGGGMYYLVRGLGGSLTRVGQKP